MPIKFIDRNTQHASEFRICPVCDSNRIITRDTSGATFLNTVGTGRVRKCTDCKITWRTIELTEADLNRLMQEDE